MDWNALVACKPLETLACAQTPLAAAKNVPRPLAQGRS